MALHSITSPISFKNALQEKIILKSLAQENNYNFDNYEIESLIEKFDFFSNNNLKGNKNKNNKNSTFFSNILKGINSKLDYISQENFDKISFKLYNKLTDVSKEFFNQLKISSELTENEIFTFNFINLNTTMSNFYIIFHRNFQNYNEVHKNIIKNTPNFLKIFFKLFEENLEIILNRISQNYKKTDFLKSIITFIAVIMQTQTNMLRPFEIKLENILNQIMIVFINCNQIEKIDKKFIDLVTTLFGNLVNLSNDINKKFPITLKNYFNSLNYYLKLIEPVSIKNKKNINIGKTDKNNKNSQLENTEKNIKKEKSKDKNPSSKEIDYEFLFDKLRESIAKNCVKIYNCIFLIFKLLKNLLKIINYNQILELNMRYIISFMVKKLFYEYTNIPTNDYIISGLKPSDYNFIISYLRFSSLKMLKTIIEIFSPYLNYFLPLFKDIMKKLTIYKPQIKANSNNNSDDYFEMKKKILKFIKILIEKYDLKIFSFTNEFVQKFAIGEFSDLLICYLEKNDKTIVQMDKSYFKLGATAGLNSKAKNSGNKANLNISLLDIAKQETYNSKLDIYNNEELIGLISGYLKIFSTYVKSESFIYSHDEEKSCVKSIIDLICFPAYTKYLFSTNEELKKNFISFINSYITSSIHSKKNSTDEVTIDEKIMFLLKNIYINENSKSKLITSFNMIHNEKNLNIITTPAKTTNLAESFLDLNKKIKERFSEILIERSENFLANKILNANNIQFPNNNLTNNLNLGDLNQTNLDTNKKSEIPISKNEDTSLLNKKTIRDDQEKQKNGEQDFGGRKEEILLFEKFASTKNPSFKYLGKIHDNKSNIFPKASISEYKSKLSTNFYLFLNKDSEKSYLTNKKVSVDQMVDKTKEDVLNSNKENYKNDFKIKFNSDSDYNQNNLDLNETDLNVKNPNLGDNAKFTTNDDIEDNDDIIIPDII